MARQCADVPGPMAARALSRRTNPGSNCGRGPGPACPCARGNSDALEPGDSAGKTIADRPGRAAGARGKTQPSRDAPTETENYSAVQDSASYAEGSATLH